MGGVPVAELNQMELEFLKMTDFSLMVTIDELVQAGESLVQFSIEFHPGTESFILPSLIPFPSRFDGKASLVLVSHDAEARDDSSSSSLSSIDK